MAPLDQQSKSISVDKQANDNVVHLYRFGETDRLPDQTFNTCPQRQVLALDFLRVSFAWAMHVGGQMPGVCAPMISVVADEPKGLEQGFELQKNFVFAAPKDICQDGTRVMIDRMPQPAGV